MHDRAYAIATGAFLVFAIAALLVVAYWLTGADQERRPFVVVSQYSVAGLTGGSEVLYRGVPAGRVQSIGLDPANPSSVLIEVAVNREVPVHAGTFARLRMRGLTGVAQVELEDSGELQAPLATSESNPARIRMAPSLLDEVTDAGTQALSMLSRMADSLGEVLNEDSREQVRSILTRVDSMLASAEHVTQTLEADLPRTLDGAARAADSVAALADRTTDSMDEVDALIAELHQTALIVQELGSELSGSGVPGLDRALEAVDRAAREMARLAQSLGRQPERLLRGRQTTPGPGEE